MNDCLFCKIIKGKIPSTKVYEDNDVCAFEDIHPAAPVHILIVPKKHITNLGAVSKEDKGALGQILLTAKKIADEKGIGDAFRVMTASGKEAGQSVFHMHFHLVGGWKKTTNLMRDDLNKIP